MSSQPAVGTTEKEHPDDVQMGVIVVPLLFSMFLAAVVLAYRCRAHRLRRNRLAQEQEEELAEMRGEGSDVLGWCLALFAGLCPKYRSCILPTNVRYVVAGCYLGANTAIMAAC